MNMIKNKFLTKIAIIYDMNDLLFDAQTSGKCEI